MEREKLMYCFVLAFFGLIMVFGFLSIFRYYANTPQRVKERAEYRADKRRESIKKVEAELLDKDYEEVEEPEKRGPPIYAYVLVAKSVLAFSLFEVKDRL